MKLVVENFGPIRKAEVELGPMTVFVGPSNTGKSYMAALIYSVLGALNKSYTHNFWKQMGESASQKQARSSLIRTFSNIPKEPADRKKRLLESVRKLFFHWAGAVSEEWKKQVSRCFAEEGGKMLKAKNLVVRISGFQERYVLDLTSPSKSVFPDKTGQVMLALPATFEEQPEKFMGLLLIYAMYVNENKFEGDLQNLPAEFGSEYMGYFSASLVYSHFSALLYAGIDGTTNIRAAPHYLPASRGGIMQSHRALVEGVFQGASASRLGAAASIPSFTGIVADFAQKIVALPPARQIRKLDAEKKKIGKIIRAMEKEIFAGKIEAKMSEMDYPEFRYKFQRNGKPQSVPLMSASSMVSELAPLAIFLRYHVNTGDFLIFEEPEAHLHPGAQRDIAKILVQLVAADVHLLVTTHSETLLEQLGNYVQAAEIGEQLNDQSLSKANISSYLFAQSKGGKKKTEVEKVEFDPETGLLPEDHRAVSSALYNETVSLLEKGDEHDQE